MIFKRKAKLSWNKPGVFVQLFLGIIALLCLSPIVLVAIDSVQYPIGHFSLRQFEKILLFRPEFFRWFRNSIFIVGSILLVNIPISLMAGYGFSRFKFPGKNALYFTYIVLMMLPFQATIIPQYLTLNWLGLINTQQALILPSIFGAFGAILMTQFIRGISQEILDAGRIDGLSEWGALIRLVVPLCRPAIAALAILLFFDNWSMVEQPVAFIQNSYLAPLSSELTASNFGFTLAAGGVLISILPILIYLFGRDELSAGIELSGVK